MIEKSKRVRKKKEIVVSFDMIAYVFLVSAQAEWGTATEEGEDWGGSKGCGGGGGSGGFFY